MSQEFNQYDAGSEQSKSPLAIMMQDAYQKAVLIKRMDEQMAQLESRRTALCQELRQIQGQLNDEFSRVLDISVHRPQMHIAAA